MKKISFYFLILCCGFLVFFVCQPVLAAALDFGLQYGGQSGLGSQDIRITIAQIIRTCLGILGIILVILIIMSGIYYFLSLGDAEKIQKAKKLLISALIGLAIILLGFALISYILTTLVGPQQPRAEQNAEGNPSPSPEGNPSPSPEGSPGGGGGGRLPVSYGCTGTIPANAIACPSPNATNLSLSADTPKQMVLSCSNDPAKCEYFCSNEKVLYQFETNGEDTNHSLNEYGKNSDLSLFNGAAINNGVLNLDGNQQWAMTNLINYNNSSKR